MFFLFLSPFLIKELVMDIGEGFVFDLSGEHPELPFAEVISVFEALDLDFEVFGCFNRVLVVGVEGLDVEYLSGRLSMSHRVCSLVGFERDYSGLIEVSSSLRPEGSFCVRAVNRGGSCGGRDVEREVGGVIDGVVDLDDPDVVYRVFIVDGGYVLGRELSDIDRGKFDRWKPTVRPHFSPVGINPRFARLIVNLSRVGRDEVLLDPFAGTGSFLIEGGFVRAFPVGVDIDRDMLLGCRRNLDFVGLDSDLIQADALNLPFRERSVDAVVADPPYGRSSRVDAGSLDELINKSVEEMFRVLKKKGYLVLVLPEGTDLIGWADEIESYRVRVHRSLTRVIRIFRRS
ncbi:methyltransferase domain-containing protein [Methanonatronarchaeum sp. AMET-Sl]|uniref:methyltransferase domain-containing protein n=1 Tax=Methanonatronarchaeum sp. AMET-Sl TaxID=3037654 RepID=UPI00244E3576|nr:methyltransferase domain-containing protein [Methanonatronarchaeum sp. AMET-Sl]WGI16773.1 methyltransferase domain-containing protein [Methanonatronarchaeum sp. AMET-Sl]